MFKSLLGCRRIPIQAKFNALVITISGWSRLKCRNNRASVNLLYSSWKAFWTFLGYNYGLYHLVSPFLVFFFAAFKFFTP